LCVHADQDAELLLFAADSMLMSMVSASTIHTRRIGADEEAAAAAAGTEEDQPMKNGNIMHTLF
jgi:hypothetical protein